MDYRDVAAHRRRWYKSLDERRMSVVAEIGWEEEDGSYIEDEVEVFVEYDVCPTCDGVGHYVNPSIDSHGISEDEWYGEWDEDEREHYMSGGYDIPCNECGGTRVVPIIDTTRNSKELVERVNNYIDELYYSARERAYEIEMDY
jgi:hypothetical protein